MLSIPKAALKINNEMLSLNMGRGKRFFRHLLLVFFLEGIKIINFVNPCAPEHMHLNLQLIVHKT